MVDEKYQVGLYVHHAPGSYEKEKHFSPKQQLRTLHSFLLKQTDMQLVRSYVDYAENYEDEEVIYDLIEDVEAGIINCVIVRELSVLGQSYKHAIDMAERFFPYHEVRLIAVRNNYDSIKTGAWHTDKLPDLREKYHSEYLCRKNFERRDYHWNKGEYNFGPVPYGYVRINSRLYVDETAAGIVRRIFENYLKGISPYRMMRDFNELGIMSPRAYSDYIRTGEVSERYRWKDCTIIRILSSRFYVGDVVHRRYKKDALDAKPSDILPKEEWLYIEDVNEPIISKEMFEAVQERMSKISKREISAYENRKPVYYGDAANMYKNIIFCECGSCLGYRHQSTWVGYRCRDREHVNSVGCDAKSVRLGEINNAVIDVLKLRFDLAIDYVTKEIVDEYIEKVTVHKEKIIFVELKIDKNSEDGLWQEKAEK